MDVFQAIRKWSRVHSTKNSGVVVSVIVEEQFVLDFQDTKFCILLFIVATTS
jgi:hypothetical protein